MKKEDSRLSEIEIIYTVDFFHVYLPLSYCCFGNKQVVLAFIFVFIVHRTVSYIFVRPYSSQAEPLKS